MSGDELYDYLDLKFEWNRMKAGRNAMFHGVKFPEAATVFLDDRNITLPDEEHWMHERPYTVIGQSVRARALLVVPMHRGERIRIISARKPTTQETRQYESE